MPDNRESTSRRILELLKQTRGGLCVPEICDNLGLSSMAVRRHLASLEAKRFVYSHQKKKRIGRPAHQYDLTDKGHDCFERDYANLVIELLESLRSLEGRGKVHDVFERRKQEQLERCRDRISGKSLESRVYQTSQLLTENGYMATWEKVGPQRYLIKLMNCAVAQVARKFPHVCIYEEELLSGLLQAKVTRQEHILQKDHFCSYVVEDPITPKPPMK